MIDKLRLYPTAEEAIDFFKDHPVILMLRVYVDTGYWLVTHDLEITSRDFMRMMGMYVGTNAIVFTRMELNKSKNQTWIVCHTDVPSDD